MAVRCAEVGVIVILLLSPVEDTVAPLSDVPPVVPEPSRTCIFDWSTSASADFTARLNSMASAPSSAREDLPKLSCGFMASSLAVAEAALALFERSFTALAAK